jgi:hypothetical protein
MKTQLVSSYPVYCSPAQPILPISPWFRSSVRLSICDRTPEQSTMSQEGRASARSIALHGGNFVEVQSSDNMYNFERIFRRASRHMAFAHRYPMIYLGQGKRSVLLSRLC